MFEFKIDKAWSNKVKAPQFTILVTRMNLLPDCLSKRRNRDLENLIFQ